MFEIHNQRIKALQTYAKNVTLDNVSWTYCLHIFWLEWLLVFLSGFWNNKHWSIGNDNDINIIIINDNDNDSDNDNNNDN